MRRIRRILAIALVILAIMAYWSYRGKMVTVLAAQYLPAVQVLPAIPAGTEIRVVLSNGITEFTKPGDTVSGFIAAPVVVGNVPVLPSGIRVNGKVEKINKTHEEAEVQLRFHELRLNGNSSSMETKPVTATTSITSDLNTLAHGFNTITGAGIGLAVGTAAQDRRTIAEGLARGTMTGTPQPTTDSTQVTVVLTEPLHVRA